jgi:HEAT repeat protein
VADPEDRVTAPNHRHAPRTLASTWRSACAALLAALLVGAALAGCSSTAGKDAKPERTAIRMQPDDPIGKLLADLDQAIARWSALTLAARSQKELREHRMLQQLVEERAQKRLDELIHEVESGPPINRMRAAAALGFSRSVEAQSPLLNALHDPSPDVVHNALLGLAVLARADTPLADICRLAEDARDEQTRAQAAYAIRAIVQAGGSGDCVAPVARRGLIDGEPFVRAQSALTLGLVEDGGSVEALIDLLDDPVPLVGTAAAESLVLVAKAKPEHKGTIGRALVRVYTADEGPISRRALDSLVQIADANYGDDVQLWLEWSERLP